MVKGRLDKGYNNWILNIIIAINSILFHVYEISSPTSDEIGDFHNYL